jgi:hypothetical protein
MVPNEPTPAGGGSGAGRAFSIHKYGMTTFDTLFTARQLVAMAELTRMVSQIKDQRLRETLATCVSKLAERNNSCCDWMLEKEYPGHLYTQQVIPASWDFAEAYPLGSSSGSFHQCVKYTVPNILACRVGTDQLGDVFQADAGDLPLPDESISVFFTDPPYYDAVPYSDLADFFFVWLKRALPDTPFSRDPFDPSNSLTPKSLEAVQDESRLVNGQPKDRHFFEQRMQAAFKEARRVLQPTGVCCIVFAHKTTEGWEALLGAMVSAGWVITASWPIATERSSRMRAKESAALESSVHLVCRPRPDNADIGDWGHVLRELPKRVADWMTRLQEEGVRGADLVFACIGPALEVFSRYSKVVDAEEREIPLGGNPESREPHLRGFLAYVWEVVGRAALEQVLGTAESKARNGAAGALEEDARLTALFLWTLQATTQDTEDVSNTDKDSEEDQPDEDDDDDAPTGKKQKKGLSLPFDVARRFAQPLGIHLDAWEGRCIETEKGIVRLVPVLDRAEQLFGQEGAEVVADRLEKHRTGPIQGTLFPVDDDPSPTPIKARKRKSEANVSDESLHKHRGATTLDHVHAAMLLQSSGRANALRALLKAEIERGPDFLRLANALSALYPQGSDEKRLLDAMLLAVPR